VGTGRNRKKIKIEIKVEISKAKSINKRQKDHSREKIVKKLRPTIKINIMYNCCMN
jgi:hypothetical protein